MERPVRNGTLFLPAEDPTKPHDREVMHPLTNAEQVLMDPNDKDNNLKNYLGLQVVLSQNDPGRPCLWAQITNTR